MLLTGGLLLSHVTSNNCSNVVAHVRHDLLELSVREGTITVQIKHGHGFVGLNTSDEVLSRSKSGLDLVELILSISVTEGQVGDVQQDGDGPAVLFSEAPH